jgi:two-component system response regulator DctR
MTPAVHIVDDDEAVRDAIQFLLRANALPAEIWPTAEIFLAHYTPQLRGCILLDVRMSGMTGPECFNQLQARGCRNPVIFLTGHGDVPMAVEALRQGAWHFLEKPFDRDALLQAVRGALTLDAEQSAQQEAEHALKRHLDALSQREREVMEKVLEGKLNKIIADELAITMRTVEVHRASLFDKMGVRSAVELAQRLAGRK